MQRLEWSLIYDKSYNSLLENSNNLISHFYWAIIKQLTRAQSFYVKSYNKNKCLKQVQNSFMQQLFKRTLPDKQFWKMFRISTKMEMLNQNEGHTGQQADKRNNRKKH